MLVKRQDTVKIVTAAKERLYNKRFNLQTQYKILKLVKAIEEEDELMNKSILIIANEYAEKDNNGEVIKTEDGGIKIDENKKAELALALNNLNSAELQLPDIYFSLEEFDGLDLTLEELDAFMPFIK